MGTDTDGAYQHIISVRNTELQALWARYNIQSVINVGFIVAIMGLPERSRLALVPGWVILVSGLLLACVWVWTAVSGRRWLSYWNTKLAELEASDKKKEP